MTVIETARLVLRRFTEDDAPFVFSLLNNPDWLRFIGNKDVHDIDAARRYIRNGPMTMYERFRFGLYLTALNSDGTPIGMCGLIRREGLDDVDIGFALLPQFCGEGYAREAAAATLDYGWNKVGLKRIVAFTSTDNVRSGRLLETVGLQFEREVTLPDSAERLWLYAAERGI